MCVCYDNRTKSPDQTDLKHDTAVVLNIALKPNVDIVTTPYFNVITILLFSPQK